MSDVKKVVLPIGRPGYLGDLKWLQDVYQCEI